MLPSLLKRGTAIAIAIVTNCAPVVSSALAQGASQGANQDALKVSVGARGAFDNQVSEVGQQQGFFKKYGLTLDVLYTQGGGETLTTVIAGAVDVGISIGTLGTLGAFAKGAPIRVIGGSNIGAYEFWYVPARSPIKSLKEAAGKTVAYSTTGSSTNLMVLGLQEFYGIKVKPVATGNPAATLTQVMSGQIDVGYSVPPFYESFLYLVLHWIILATSWNILCGYSGYFSFGHGAFFGAGMYTTAALASRLDVPFLWTLPAAGAIAAAMGLALGAVVSLHAQDQGFWSFLEPGRVVARCAE